MGELCLQTIQNQNRSSFSAVVWIFWRLKFFIQELYSETCPSSLRQTADPLPIFTSTSLFIQSPTNLLMNKRASNKTLLQMFLLTFTALCCFWNNFLDFVAVSKFRTALYIARVLIEYFIFLFVHSDLWVLNVGKSHFLMQSRAEVKAERRS